MQENFHFFPISFHHGWQIWKIFLGKAIPQAGQGNLRIGETEGRFSYWAFRDITGWRRLKLAENKLVGNKETGLAAAGLCIARG
jgi:hypothetical protein